MKGTLEIRLPIKRSYEVIFDYLKTYKDAEAAQYSATDNLLSNSVGSS